MWFLVSQCHLELTEDLKEKGRVDSRTTVQHCKFHYGLYEVQEGDDSCELHVYLSMLGAFKVTVQSPISLFASSQVIDVLGIVHQGYFLDAK